MPKSLTDSFAALVRAWGAIDIRELFLCASKEPISPKHEEAAVPEKLLISMLNAAESWAARARSSLVHIHTLDRSGFVAGRRPEERALLAAAADVVDLVRATPGGAALLAEFGIGVPGSAQMTEEDLRERLSAGGRGSAQIAVSFKGLEADRPAGGLRPRNGNGGV